MKVVKLNSEDFETNGLEFVVQSETETHYIGATNYHIPKVACTVLQSGTQPEQEDSFWTTDKISLLVEKAKKANEAVIEAIKKYRAKKELISNTFNAVEKAIEPEQWVPKVGEWAVVEKITDTGESLTGQYYHVGEVFEIKKVEKSGFNRVGYWLYNKDGYEASLSACRKALPNEIPQPEPKGHCIKANDSNIEQLSEWVKLKDGTSSLKVGNWVLSCPCERMCIPMHETTTGSTFHEEYTELFTVEEFFAKVNYTPEHKEMWSSSFAPNLTSTPKLIAKAGEWVKIVDFGTIPLCNRKGFTINKPYQLRFDLDMSGKKGFGVVACDSGEENGWTYFADNKQWLSLGMKFEFCPAPVSEPVQVDTPIERSEKPIDKVTIERLDLVLRMCNIQLHSTLIDKIIDCVELVEEKGEETSLMDVCKMQAEWKRL